jgi:acyl-CoA reductase-like NAD-dependent aldehyde dehydrogenase
MEERAKGFGDPTESTTTHGPLVDELQFKRVSGFVERGASQGKLLTGGTPMNRVVSISQRDAEILTSSLFRGF